MLAHPSPVGEDAGMMGIDLSDAMSEVRREPVAVMFLEVADNHAGITNGWERLERTVGDLRGRRFFGTVEAQAPGYRVGAAT